MPTVQTKAGRPPTTYTHSHMVNVGTLARKHTHRKTYAVRTNFVNFVPVHRTTTATMCRR